MTGPSGRSALPRNDDTSVAPGAAQVLSAFPDPSVLVDIDVDAVDAEWRPVWANPAARAVADDPTDLLGQLTTPGSVPGGRDSRAGLVEALRGEQALSVVRNIRSADGSGSYATVSFSRLGAGSAGRQRWLVTVRAVADELASALLAVERSAAEERARYSLSLVARVSDVLADRESVNTLADIAQLLVPRAVRWAAFYGADRRLRQITELSGGTGSGPEPRRRRRTDLTEPDPVRNLLAEPWMQTIVLTRDVAGARTMTAELLELVAADPALPAEADPLWLLPVLGRYSVLGLLAVVPGVPGPTAPADRAAPGPNQAMTAAELTTLLELVARRVGMAMDNIQLYDREHRLAETLQRAMLPEQRAVEGLDVWSYYEPNSEHAQVGGDWYDVVEVGRNHVGVVVGDVVGHDVEAAAAMGQLRSVVRAYAAEFIDPGTVLGRVDRLVAGLRIARAASFVYATLTPVEGADGWDVAYSRAGHLPPILVSDGQATQLDGAGGRLVGFGSQHRHTAHTHAKPGDVLIFYTDGLVERRDRPMRDGVQRLAEVAAGVVAPDAAGIGEEVLLQLADAPEDDIALVVVRVPDAARDPAHPSELPRQRRWQMPIDPETIGRARRAVLSTCRAWGIEGTPAVELVVSELVANAVMHGWGRVELRLQDAGGGLRIEVEDANPAPPVRREGHAGRVGGFGLHIVARLADWGWRPTPTGKVVWALMRSGSRPWSAGGTGR